MSIVPKQVFGIVYTISCLYFSTFGSKQGRMQGYAGVSTVKCLIKRFFPTHVLPHCTLHTDDSNHCYSNHLMPQLPWLQRVHSARQSTHIPTDNRLPIKLSFSGKLLWQLSEYNIISALISSLSGPLLTLHEYNC